MKNSPIIVANAEQCIADLYKRDAVRSQELDAVTKQATFATQKAGALTKDMEKLRTRITALEAKLHGSSKVTDDWGM